MEKFPKSLYRLLDGRGTKRSALSDKEKILGSSKKNLSLEPKNLVVDKDKDVPTKEDRSTKRNFKNLVSTYKGATNKHHIKHMY